VAVTRYYLQAYYVTVVEDRPLLSAEYRLLLLAKNGPSSSAVSLTAELLVYNSYTVKYTLCHTSSV